MHHEITQIAEQAIEKNVTLISYNHLYFLIDNFRNQNIQQIWENGNILKKQLNKIDLTKY